MQHPYTTIPRRRLERRTRRRRGGGMGVKVPIWGFGGVAGVSPAEGSGVTGAQPLLGVWGHRAPNGALRGKAP